MSPALVKAAVAICVGAVLWAFVGFERIVGDHEMGNSWEPFIKHRPSVQMAFQNPSQKGLEILPFEALSRDDQAAFMEFCAIRFGVQDPRQCRAIVIKRMV